MTVEQLVEALSEHPATATVYIRDPDSEDDFVPSALAAQDGSVIVFYGESEE